MGRVGTYSFKTNLSKAWGMHRKRIERIGTQNEFTEARESSTDHIGTYNTHEACVQNVIGTYRKQSKHHGISIGMLTHNFGAQS